MVWQEAMVYNIARELSQAEFQVWEASRGSNVDMDRVARRQAIVDEIKSRLTPLQEKVDAATGPLQVFGGTDTWMETWDETGNWIEAMVSNTPAKDCVAVLTHLNIMPMIEKHDHWDGSHSITNSKPISLTEVNDDGKIVPINQIEFFSIIKTNYPDQVRGLGSV